MSRATALYDVNRERDRQIEKGWPQDPADVACLVLDRATEMRLGAPLRPQAEPFDPRKLWVEIGALSVAAIESINRKKDAQCAAASR